MRKQHFLRWLSGIWAVCLAVTGLPVLHVQGEALSVSAESCILMEAVTGEVLYEKAADQQRPMASTTKIMTTLLCLESGDLDTPCSVDNDAVQVEGSSMGLVDGDIVTKRALCYGMLLPSGNDAAGATIARNARGNGRLFRCRKQQCFPEGGGIFCQGKQCRRGEQRCGRIPERGQQ